MDTIKDAVVDFSQLNLRTFVGAINVTVRGDADPDWDALMKTALDQGVENGVLADEALVQGIELAAARTWLFLLGYIKDDKKKTPGWTPSDRARQVLC